MGKEQAKDHCLKIPEMNRCETHVYLSQTPPRWVKNLAIQLSLIVFAL